jgi:hypothetical protein
MEQPTDRFSQLSKPRQLLVRLFQATNYGYIDGLEIQRSEPVFDPQSVVAIDLKLDTEEGERVEADLADIRLPKEIGRLMSTLDEIGNGKITRIEVRAGLPRRIIIERRISELHLGLRTDGGAR